MRGKFISLTDKKGDRKRCQAGLELEKSQRTLMDVTWLSTILESNVQTVQTTKLYYSWVYIRAKLGVNKLPKCASFSSSIEFP